ncbi:MAG: LruC domain-containing protein [Spirochaetota bacterium]
MRRVMLLLSVLFATFVGCGSELIGTSTKSVLPADQVNDILRQGEFDYSLVAPVEFSITVNSFDDAGEGARALVESAPIVVSLTDANGDPLLVASVADGETMSGEVLVTVSDESVTLTIDSPEHETREVVIDDPAQFEEINRVMAVMVATGEKVTSDRDGDGIDDYYDAFPDDPQIAFSRTIPASGSLKIAFEDNYPELGDGDYNDFVADYRVVEHRDAKNGLVRVEGTARASARGAGFDHEFGIVVDFPGHSGTAEVRYFDGNGSPDGTTTQEVNDAVRIVLFESTKAAFTREGDSVSNDNVDPDRPASLGYTTTFTITYTVTRLESSTAIWAPYDPYLLIDNPNLDYRPDVHLIGKRPLADSANPSGFKDFRDADGFPRALLVPGDWATPVEQTHIETAYPSFRLWRESLGSTDSDWYFYPESAHVASMQ